MVLARRTRGKTDAGGGEAAAAKAGKAAAAAQEQPPLIRSSRGRRGARQSAPTGAVDVLADIRGRLIQPDPATECVAIARAAPRRMRRMRRLLPACAAAACARARAGRGPRASPPRPRGGRRTAARCIDWAAGAPAGPRAWGARVAPAGAASTRHAA